MDSDKSRKAMHRTHIPGFGWMSFGFCERLMKAPRAAALLWVYEIATTRCGLRDPLRWLFADTPSEIGFRTAVARAVKRLRNTTRQN